MTAPEIHTLTGAFALDALSEHERARFERHLEECESCAQEVRELRATATRLGMAVAQDPPTALKERVFAEIRATRQQPPATKNTLVEGVNRRAEMPRWALRVSVAAAVIGLVLAGVFGVWAFRSQSELNAARQSYAPVTQVLAALDANTAQANSDIGGVGSVIMSKSLDRMVFLGSRLSRPADKDLQVWLLKPGEKPRSAGLLPHDSSGEIVAASGVSGTTQVALTVEPQGGSPTGQPTSNPVLRVFLDAASA
jgi:anti-sigma-K factor RskA